MHCVFYNYEHMCVLYLQVEIFQLKFQTQAVSILHGTDQAVLVKRVLLSFLHRIELDMVSRLIIDYCQWLHSVLLFPTPWDP
jgi:hypothetical protein